MDKSSVLVIGLGEVGCSLFELFSESGQFEVYGWDVDKQKVNTLQQSKLPSMVDVLHICYRCIDQQTFIKTTVNYVKRFSPNLTIINSTIPPGTTEKIHSILPCQIVHSPVRGVHENRQSMKRYLLFWKKYVGGIDKRSAELACKHFARLQIETKILTNPTATELAKLFETTYRAWMIACFQEMHRITRHFEADFEQVVDFLEDTHRVRLDRPLHFPDVIGGHCLIPNAELLLASYDSEFVKLVLKSNDQRRHEVEDPRTCKEIAGVREKVKNLERDLFGEAYASIAQSE